MDPILLEIFKQGGLAGVAGLALWLLHRTHLRNDDERKATITTLSELIKGTLAETKEQTAAFTRLCERMDSLLTRGGRRAA